MKIGFQIKIADGKDEQTIALIANRHIRQNVISILKSNSQRVLHWNIMVGHDADDFVRGLITIVCQGKAYKVSRIIKNFLLKKYEVRHSEHRQ